MGQREVFKTGPWSQEEKEELTRLYQHHTLRQIAAVLNRKFAEAKQQRKNLRLTKDTRWRPFDHEQDALIRRLYPTHQPSEIAAMINRSANVVSYRAAMLGIRRPRDIKPIGAERLGRCGRPVRKVANAPHAEATNWKLVEVIEWEKINGPLPADQVLIVVNKDLPRSPENMMQVRKEDRWLLNAIEHPIPEIRELKVLKRQIEREALRPKPK